MPTTSAPAVGDFLEVYEPLLKETNEIVSVHISSKLSATHDNACQAAQVRADRGARIEVFDSRVVSLGLMFVTLAAPIREVPIPPVEIRKPARPAGTLGGAARASGGSYCVDLPEGEGAVYCRSSIRPCGTTSFSNSCVDIRNPCAFVSLTACQRAKMASPRQQDSGGDERIRRSMAPLGRALRIWQGLQQHTSRLADF